MDRMIKAEIRHPRKTNVLKVEIPVSTIVHDLQKIVVENAYATPYIMGFKFIIKDHLLTDSSPLEYYIPEDAKEVVIDIFDIPETTV